MGFGGLLKIQLRYFALVTLGFCVVAVTASSVSYTHLTLPTKA